jgi:pyruvoyl-dependent arginine decarboxylase (PvlArgDC)
LIQEGLKEDLIERIRRYLLNGEKDVHKNSNLVYKYDKNGLLVNKYESIKEASIKSKLPEDSISCAINKEWRKTAGGYIWRKEETKFSKEELKRLTKQSRAKEVIKKKNGEEIMRYESVTEASNIEKLSTGIIDRVCKGKKEMNGYIWSYENENNNKQLSDEDKKEIREKSKKGINVKEISEIYCKSIKQIRRVLKN